MFVKLHPFNSYTANAMSYLTIKANLNWLAWLQAMKGTKKQTNKPTKIGRYN